MNIASQKVESPPKEKPILIYDGDCQFCQRWINRWKLITKDSIEYRKSQDLDDRFPEIPSSAFETSVVLVDTNGTVFRGAHAVFRSLKNGLLSRYFLKAYERSNIFSKISESIYTIVSKRRIFFSKANVFFSGKNLEPNSYVFSSWLFLRLLGLTALFAVGSLWVQAHSLFGNEGILPFQDLLTRVEPYFASNEAGHSKFQELPTLFWFGASDQAIHFVFGIASLASLMLLFGFCPMLASATLLITYLSIIIAGQRFLGFQWDSLLIETLLLAIFISPWTIHDKLSKHPPPSRIARYLVWLLLFKLMFESGIVKFTYFDSDGSNTWRDYTALNYHYFTQPIPSPTSWYFHHMPFWFQKLSLYFTYIVEFILPFFIFGPRNFRRAAFIGLVLLQVLIMASGNYGYFNTLTIVLCIALLDDQSLLFKFNRNPQLSNGLKPNDIINIFSRAREITLLVFLCLALLLMFNYLDRDFQGNRSSPKATTQGKSFFETTRSNIRHNAQSLRLYNSYGLFRVMTKERPEIIISASNDGVEWKEYSFKYKPSDPMRSPAFFIPHMPRLDWQMWFAALEFQASGRLRREAWINPFLEKLFKGEPAIVSLVESNPFPDAPPKMFKVELYLYTFTTPAERKETNAIWKRQRLPRYTIQGKIN